MAATPVSPSRRWSGEARLGEGRDMLIARIEGATRIVGRSQGYHGLPLRDEMVACPVNGPATPCMVTASSEERRVGKGCVRTCGSRGSAYPLKKTEHHTRHNT